jgi:hypothetical protein
MIYNFQNESIKYIFCILIFLLSSNIQAQTISVGNPAGAPFCTGATINFNFTITGVFTSGNTFTAQLSDASGSFASPVSVGTVIGTTSGTMFVNIPAGTPSGAGYVMRIVSNAPVITSSNTTASFSVTSPTGSPSVFGSGQWNAYVFNSTNFTNYSGLFTVSPLSFNSTTYYGSNSAPSTATGFSGCSGVNQAAYSISYKRTNFTCDYYTIRIENRDDEVEVLVDGVSVSNLTSASNTGQNVWSGILGPTSTVELRHRQTGAGTGYLQVSLNTSPAITLPASVTKCVSATVPLTVTSPSASLTYAWSPATGLSATTGSTVNANPAATTTYTVIATDPTTGCTFNGTVTVNVGALPVVSVSPASVSVCNGTSTTLTASGASNYVWSPATGLSATTGSTVTANPLVTTTYTVIGDDGCGNTSTATVTVTIGSGTNPNVFGNGQWNVYAYTGNLVGAPGSAVVQGFYTEPLLSFNSVSRWDSNFSPSDASGYVGCVVGVDNHSVSYKRTNFTCALYQLDVVQHDDAARINLDGTQIYAINGWSGSSGAPHVNVRRVLLTSLSNLEFYWQEGGGGSNGQVNVTALANTELILPTQAIICPGNSATLTIDPNIALSGAYTVSWTGPSGFTATGSSVTSAAGVVGTYTATMTHTASGCTISDNIDVILDPNPPTIAVNPTAVTICPGGSTTLTASGATTFTWKNGVTTIGTGTTITLSPAVTTTYTLEGTNGCGISTLSVTVTVQTIPGNPAVFGNGVWNAYSYQGSSFNTYLGYYTENNLNFNSATRWNGNGSPSDANAASGAAYTGCAITPDNHSVIYKRTNFTCGYYRLDIPGHDDAVTVFIDGVQVFYNGGCCATRPDIWRGFLGPSSTVEYRWQEGVGGSNGQLTFTDLTSTLSSFTSPPVTICQGSTTTMTAALMNSNGPGAVSCTFSWQVLAGGNATTLNTTTGSSVVATAGSYGSGATATVRCTATDPASGCQWSNDILITVDPLPTTAATSNSYSICRGETITLTATGANTYTWTQSSVNGGLVTTTGSIVTATPTQPGTYTYTAAGNNNCATINGTTATITVLGTTLTGAEFGNSEWNTFAYEYTNAASIDNPALANIRGYYTEKSLSFNTIDRWGNNSSPSTAGLKTPSDGSAAYTGCAVTNDNHLTIHKRTNFACGYYVISVAYHDDSYRLFVNGTLVGSHTGCCDSHPNVWSGLLNSSSTIEYRVIEGGGQSSSSLSIGFSLASPTTVVWNGGAGNTDWFNALNWCPAAPTATTDVIIPGSGVPAYPNINANGATCKSLSITTGASLTITGSYNLDVNGNFDNQGTFTPNSSTVNVINTGDVTLNSSGTGSFYNLIINKPSNVVSMSSGIVVNNQLTLANGELRLNAQQLTINNTSNTAITRSNNAFIRSENNVAINPSLICWNMGSTVAIFTYPFGTAENSSGYIPVTYDKKTNTSTTVCVSTRATSLPDNLPLVPGTNMVGVSGATATNVIDRWWEITSSTNPLPNPAADITLRYLAAENTIANPTTNLSIQHFNSGINDWDNPFSSFAPGVTTGIGSVGATGVQNYSPFVISTTSTPLPVTLLDFRANFIASQTQLNWEISDDRDANTEYFLVERSVDGKNFQTIGKVKIVNNSNKYTYNDKPNVGVNYYRLKMITSGQYEYSEIVSIHADFANSEFIKAKPNPSSAEKLNLVLQASPSEKIRFVIADNNGKIVWEDYFDTDVTGFSEKTLTTNLAPGIYHIIVYDSKSEIKNKIVIY